MDFECYIFCYNDAATCQTLIMHFGAISPPWECSSNSTICLSDKTYSYDDKQRYLISCQEVIEGTQSHEVFL